MEHKNLLIVGAGGIGSWLCYYLYNLQEVNQLKFISVTVADDDTVEQKNLSYQKFESLDILDNKALALEAKYGFKGLDKKIVSTDDLEPFDCVVSAVDNTSFRRMLFNYCAKNPDTYFIDLRSEGTAITSFTSSPKNDLEYLLSTIPQEIEDASCQRPFELQGGIIQQGNKIIAGIGSQYILNYMRGHKNTPRFSAAF